jgi:hypothetical protein
VSTVSAVLRRMGRWLQNRCRRPWVHRRQLSVGALAIGTLTSSSPREGPYDIMMFATPAAPTARAHARLVFSDSPFGVALTADGHARYDVEITEAKLPAPATLGNFSGYAAWAVTPDLTQWERLGPVTNGNTTVGSVDFNKFLLVVTAERDSTSHAGPTVLHGSSPSGWLQTFLTQPTFHGITD